MLLRLGFLFFALFLFHLSSSLATCLAVFTPHIYFFLRVWSRTRVKFGKVKWGEKGLKYLPVSKISWSELSSKVILLTLSVIHGSLEWPGHSKVNVSPFYSSRVLPRRKVRIKLSCFCWIVDLQPVLLTTSKNSIRVYQICSVTCGASPAIYVDVVENIQKIRRPGYPVNLKKD
jgi:hypothetical protein